MKKKNHGHCRKEGQSLRLNVAKVKAARANKWRLMGCTCTNHDVIRKAGSCSSSIKSAVGLSCEYHRRGNFRQIFLYFASKISVRLTLLPRGTLPRNRSPRVFLPDCECETGEGNPSLYSPCTAS